MHDESILTDLQKALDARGLEVRRISAAGNQGLDELLHDVFAAVEAENAADAAAAAAAGASSSGAAS